MDSFLQDLRYGVRRLLKSPGFSAIVVLTLALGIGANTAIFSVVNAVLLRPLPYREPERLTTIEHFYPSLNGLEAPVSATGFADYRDKTHVFESMAIETGWGPALTGHGDPERLGGSRVSALFFQTLGISPAIGRPLLPEEDQPGRNHVVVLSDGLWRRVFGADPKVVGQTMILNGEAYEIVGVMPRGFRDFYNRTADLWTPLALPPEQYHNDNARTNEWLNCIARLKRGITIDRARAEMASFAAGLVKQYPDPYPPNWTLHVTPLSEKASGKIRPALLVLLGAVGFVLLIACANVANLMLARGAARLKEIAIRAALGAKRTQLVRQLLTESMLLAVAGGVLGLLLAFWGVNALATLNPSNVPGADRVGIDASVVVFTLLVSLITGVLFGLAPAVQTSHTNLQQTLREGGRSGTGDRTGQRTRRVLVVAEIALALVLLTGAGLLMKSFARLQGVDPGFVPERLLTFNLALPNAKYPSDTAQIAYYDQALARIAAVPGVRAVGATSVMPFGGSWSTGSFQIEGVETPPNQPGPWGDIRVVSPDFFKALGVPLIKGRTFTPQDNVSAPRVAVVDEEMVRRYWPKEDPIGKRITRGAPPGQQPNWITVIGVVGHTKHEGLDADARVQLYYPYEQRGTGFMSVAVRTVGDPSAALPAVRDAVHQVDKDIPLSGVKTMDELLEASVGQRKLAMFLIALFAGIALLLASIGIYGVMSYSVTQRSRELGVRMALGAARGDVLGLVLRQGMVLAVIGVVLGVAGALALTRLIASQLYSVKPNDPMTFVIVAALLSAIAAVATLLPALRATRVDPVIALREE